MRWLSVKLSYRQLTSYGGSGLWTTQVSFGIKHRNYLIRVIKGYLNTCWPLSCAFSRVQVNNHPDENVTSPTPSSLMPRTNFNRFMFLSHRKTDVLVLYSTTYSPNQRFVEINAFVLLLLSFIHSARHCSSQRQVWPGLLLSAVPKQIYADAAFRCSSYFGNS